MGRSVIPHYMLCIGSPRPTRNILGARQRFFYFYRVSALHLISSSGNKMSEENFDVEEFKKGPSREKLERCTKDNLLLLANFFGVDVPLNANKEEQKKTTK